MRKLSLQFLSALVSCAHGYRQAVSIFVIAFTLSSISYSGMAQVVITPGSGGIAICSRTAVGGSLPSCTTLGPITITETNNFDFPMAGSTITLTPPIGWQFCIGSAPVVSFIPGQDVSVSGIAPFTSTSLQLNITTTGITHHDAITITGLQVQALSVFSVPGSITASAVSGVVGIVIGTGIGATDFADLALIPSTINGLHDVCVGSCITLSSGPAGGVWTTSNPAIATVTGAGTTANVCGVATGSATITYTVGGCFTTQVVAVHPNPPAMTVTAPLPYNWHMCAWYDTLTFVDADTNGVYTSALITVTNIGAGRGKVHAYMPGVATLSYTLPSGCSVSATITVDPLPAPIQSPPYVVCQGSFDTLTDATPGGTWASISPGIGTIDPLTGIFYGVAPGNDMVTYTIPGGFGAGCITDTIITVNPVPAPITGLTEICLGQITTLTDTTLGGAWTSTVDPMGTFTTTTGDLHGTSVGTSLVSYTLINGCAATIVVTVDGLPGPITGPDSVCVGDSILLFDGSPFGHWSSGNPGIATVDSVTGNVIGVAGGVVIITYAIMPGHCIATYAVTVNALPGPITGPDSVCVGQSIPLLDSGVGYWTSVYIGIATVDPTGMVTGFGSGVDTIHFTNAHGCRVSFVVTVNPLPSPISGSHNICIGDSTLLTDITTGGGTWSTSDPAVAPRLTTYSDSVWIFGNSAGTATITFTSTSGCYTTFTVTVNAYPLPIFSDSAVCSGQTIRLYDSLIGGVWSVADTTRAIITSSGVISGLDYADVTGVLLGSTIVYYTGPGGCRVARNFTVFQNAPIIGPHTFCLGDTIGLSNSAPNGTWVPSDSTIAHVHGWTTIGDTANVWGITAGTVTITYTNPAGCVSTFAITVNPVPVLSGPTAICDSGSITITTTIPGGTWTLGSSSNGILTPSSTTTEVFTGYGPGVDTIFYSMPTGCGNFHIVTVNPLPDSITGKDSVCMGDTIQLHETTLSGTYSFTNGNATVDPLTGTVLGVHEGLDTVIYTVGATSCVSKIKVIKINSLYPIYGADTVCVGQITLLQDSTHGVGFWSTANNIADTITSVTVGVGGSSAVDSGRIAGVDTVFYTIPATGCRTYIVVTVHPLPTINGLSEVCEGASIILTGHTSGGFWAVTNAHASVTAIDDSTALVTGLLVGVDTIRYTLPTGCPMTFIVTVNHTPTPIFGPHYICVGRSIVLTDASPGGTWSSTNPSILTIDNTGLITGITTGVDTIMYTLPVTSCSAGLTVTVEPIPTIILTQTHPTVICIGASDTLLATGAGPLATYTWSPSFGLSATTGARVIASPTLTTTYVVTGTSQWGCDSTSTITVLVDSTFLHLKVIGRDSICVGDHDTLRASGRDSTYFNWHPVASLSCVICDTTIATPTVTTTYYGIAIDDIGCKDSVTFTVNVNPLPIILVTPNPAILCYGTPLQLHAHVTGVDSTSTTFAWSPNLFISNDSVKNPIVTDTTNLVYRLIAISKYGCLDSFKVKVSVLDTNVNSIALDTNICIGTSAQLYVMSHSVTSNLDIPSYTWTPANSLNNPNIWDPIATPNVTTTYSVHVHENACFDTTMQITVFVQPYPVITITPGSETIVAGTPTQETATVTNTPVLYYVWAPANTLSCDSCLNPVAIPTVNTTYKVVVSSIYHCISEDSVTLNMVCDNSQIFVPNTFTPNGDGINDRFWVSGKGISLITLFQVYNRWGELLWEEHNIPPNDAAYGWDGTYKGLVLEPDVFVYIVKAKCELGGTEFKYKGDISLVR